MTALDDLPSGGGRCTRGVAPPVIMKKHRALKTALRPIRYTLRAVKYAVKAVTDAYSYIAFRPSHFRGVYETFEQAEASAPPGSKIGYNHEALARAYRRKLNLRLSSFDYPILSHLGRILRDHSTVLDFGGNIGIHYLSYKDNLDLTRVNWIVWDVPEIIKAGRETCAGLSNVAFVNDIADVKASRVDIFLASGSMQYMASPHQLIQNMIHRNVRPNHILINRVPLYAGERFVTLQNGELVYLPQYVFNREEFIRGIIALQYELIDFWDSDVDSCIIPFHPTKSVRVFKGLYFRTKPTDGYPDSV